jgi:hypothetical protein
MCGEPEPHDRHAISNRIRGGKTEYRLDEAEYQYPGWAKPEYRNGPYLNIERTKECRI